MRVNNRTLTPLTRAEILNKVSEFCNGLPETEVQKQFLQKTIFKKLRSSEKDQSLSAKAQAIFLKTEEACALTNLKIRSCRRNQNDYARSSILYIATRKIQQILGPFSINRMLDLGRFGPGSTYGCRGFDVSSAKKFSLTDVTLEFQQHARGLLAEYPLWSRSLCDADDNVCPTLTPVKGGRYSTVPKDAKIDRSIIVEPTINSWFQQGIGRMIREKLKNVGVDLNDQSTNQRLAKLGSITNDLATVDLSSASDLIASELVKDLLPSDWFTWLNLTRSQSVFIDGEWKKLEKFSSMGNGFTFDLQSLIFFALASAIVENEGYNTFWVNTFGDDIVVPSGVKDSIIECFKDVGFTINIDKSFFEGPFRESCGHDYYNGINVRGIYIKDMNTELDVVKCHNRFFTWGVRTGIKVSDLLSFLRTKVGDFRHFRVPCHLGDVGVFHHFDEATPSLARHGWEGFRVRIVLPVLATAERSDRFLLLHRVQHCSSDFARNQITLRRDPIGYTSKEITTDWNL